MSDSGNRFAEKLQRIKNSRVNVLASLSARFKS